jgi:hypothetical protein
MSQATSHAKKGHAAVSAATTPKLNPQAAITIAVDTQYVAAQQGQNISQGIYMMDNRVNNGSTGEGTLELNTHAQDGNLIGFNVVPINPTNGDTVVITGFTVQPPPGQTGVFGSQGYPEQQPALGAEPAGGYWIGQATAQGSQTYQIQIEVTTGGLRPTSYFVNWDPFINSN